MRIIHCKKLNKQLEGLTRTTYPGALGLKIFNEISNEAWQMWLRQQTILINEYRLNPLDPKARTFLKEQMQAFLFGDGGETPNQFKPL